MIGRRRRRQQGSRLAALGFAGLALAVVVFALLFGAAQWHSRPQADKATPLFGFEPVAFADIPGWTQDDHSAALGAFLRSCARIAARAPDAAANPLEALGAGAAVSAFAGRSADWRAACERAAETAPDRARAFFETAFTPFRIGVGTGDAFDPGGLFTAYFEPEYEARRAPEGPFSAPALARPADLVTVDLGRFRPELAGQRIAGSVDGGVLIPYPDHGEINSGALDGRAPPLAYLRPDDLLFMQIQGSGRIKFPDGATMRLGYDGQNGHVYTPVGRVLIERGAVAREAMSMEAIRAWLAAAPPEDARALREANASYVFFRELTDLTEPELGPLGADSVQLTAMRSLAVDRRYHALGAPVFVSIAPGGRGLEAGLARLFIAQDTGGAIRGVVRGDIFVGSGPEAGRIAGGVAARGEMIILLPIAAAARLYPAGDVGAS